jgi:hypothetical protein
MKKAIIGLSGIIVLALAVVLFVNAGTVSNAEKKTATELKADCGNCPSAATCPHAEKSAAGAPCCDKEKASKPCAEPEAMMAGGGCGACPMHMMTSK